MSWLPSSAARLFSGPCSEYWNQRFPFISTGVFFSGVSICWLGRPSTNEENGTWRRIKRASKRVLNMIKTDNIPTLPAQEQKKPVVLFDIENVLIKPRRFPLNFCFNEYKRRFADVFLFDLAHLYELVSITSSEDEKLYKRIDPYGCISYRLFIPDKRLFEPRHLNRELERVVCIASKEGEYNNKFQENILDVGSWSELSDSNLLWLLDFLVNLCFAGIGDWRKTISSYRGKSFYATYNKIHKSIFFKRNFLTLDLENKYENTVGKINKSRILEFLRAKAIMEENIAKNEVENREISVYEIIANFVKCVLF